MYQRLFWFADKCIYAIIAVQEAYQYGRRIIQPLKGALLMGKYEFLYILILTIILLTIEAIKA